MKKNSRRRGKGKRPCYYCEEQDDEKSEEEEGYIIITDSECKNRDDRSFHAFICVYICVCS